MSLAIISMLIILYNTHTYKYEIETYINYMHSDTSKPIKEDFVNYLIDWDRKERRYDEKIADIYNTSLENYKSGVDFHNTSKKYYQQYIELSDVKSNNPFFAYGCIKNILQNDLLITLQKMFYVSYHEFYSISMNDITQKVAEDIDKTMDKMNGQELKDPIYFLIFQAPHFQFNNETYIARHDSANNLKPSYEQNVENVSIGEKPLLTKIFVMYPYYYHDPMETTKILPYTNDEGYKAFKQYFNDSKMTRDKLCFIECNGVNGYACGCLNSEKGQNNAYTSKCINLDNEFFDYGMVYAVNKFNPLFQQKFITKNYII